MRSQYILIPLKKKGLLRFKPFKVAIVAFVGHHAFRSILLRNSRRIFGTTSWARTTFSLFFGSESISMMGALAFAFAFFRLRFRSPTSRAADARIRFCFLFGFVDFNMFGQYFTLTEKRKIIVSAKNGFCCRLAEIQGHADSQWSVFLFPVLWRRLAKRECGLVLFCEQCLCVDSFLCWWS